MQFIKLLMIVASVIIGMKKGDTSMKICPVTVDDSNPYVYNNQCWYFTSTRGSFDECQRICLGYGLNMSEINDIEENIFAESILSSYYTNHRFIFKHDYLLGDSGHANICPTLQNGNHRLLNCNRFRYYCSCSSSVALPDIQTFPSFCESWTEWSPCDMNVKREDCSTGTSSRLGYDCSLTPDYKSAIYQKRSCINTISGVSDSIVTKINNKNDDIEYEPATPACHAHGRALDIPYRIAGEFSNERIVLLRFRNVLPPLGYDIVHTAFVTFEADESSNEIPLEVDIKYIEGVTVNTEVDKICKASISLQNEKGVNWQLTEWQQKNTYSTPDITDLLQKYLKTSSNFFLSAFTIGFYRPGNSENYRLATSFETAKDDDDRKQAQITVTYKKCYTSELSVSEWSNCTLESAGENVGVMTRVTSGLIYDSRSSSGIEKNEVEQIECFITDEGSDIKEIKAEDSGIVRTNNLSSCSSSKSVLDITNFSYTSFQFKLNISKPILYAYLQFKAAAETYSSFHASIHYSVSESDNTNICNYNTIVKDDPIYWTIPIWKDDSEVFTQRTPNLKPIISKVRDLQPEWTYPIISFHIQLAKATDGPTPSIYSSHRNKDYLPRLILSYQSEIWGEWSLWTKCSVTCGKEIQTRTRECLSVSCSGESVNKKYCIGGFCPGWSDCTYMTACNATCNATAAAWLEWSTWSSCSASCGDGFQIKTRSCSTKDQCNGKSVAKKSCSMQSCPTTAPSSTANTVTHTDSSQVTPSVDEGLVDGWTQWSNWSDCSGACLGSTKSKRRTCLQEGACRGESVESIDCIDRTRKCIKWLDWQEWNPCDVTCGSGFQIRRRNCTEEDKCLGSTSSVRDCVAPIVCPGMQNSSWFSDWSHWGECELLHGEDCGTSTRSRYQRCMVEDFCEDDREEREICPETDCYVDGEWSMWGEWGTCSKSCAGGQKIRKRLCNNPAPSSNGDPCYGSNLETESCSTHACRVDGGFSIWSPWTPCNRICNGGVKHRERTCSNPEPRFGGNECNGNFQENATCNKNPCEGAKTIFVTTRLIKETYSSKLVDSNTKEYGEYAETLKEKMKGFLTEKEGILNITVESLRNGSIIPSMIIYYSNVNGLDLIPLKYNLEFEMYFSTMPVNSTVLRASPEIPPAPENLIAYAASSTTIMILWSKYNETVNNIIGIVVAFKEYSLEDTSFEYRVLPDRFSTSYNLTDLKSFATYAITITAYDGVSIGYPSDFFVVKASEGVPSHRPKRMTCLGLSENSLMITWETIDEKHWNGFMGGYSTKYKIYGENAEWKFTNFSATSSSGIIKGLNSATMYEVELSAFTEIGSGPWQWTHCSTNPIAMSIAPDRVTSIPNYSPHSVKISWKKVNQSQTQTTNLIKGYRIRYGISRIGGISYKFPEYKTKDVDESVRTAILRGFHPFSEVTVQVAAVTSIGIGPWSTQGFADTCRCPASIYSSWYEDIPYVYKSKSDVQGTFPTFIRNMMNSICGSCERYSYVGYGSLTKRAQLYFDRTKDGYFAQKLGLEELLKTIDDSVHIHFPVSASSFIETFQNKYRFIPLLKNSGSAHIVKIVPKKIETVDVITALVNGWTALVIIVLVSHVCGLIFWMLDRLNSSEKFLEERFVNGSFQGTWLAINTMTTVGYGDSTPKGIPAKVFTIACALAGLIIVALFSSLISTVMYAEKDTSEYKALYGSKIGVIANSQEYNVAVRRNAKVAKTVTFQNQTSELLSSLDRNEIDGVLMSYEYALSMKDHLNSMHLHIVDVIDSVKAVGIVLSSDLILLEPFIRSYAKEFMMKNMKDSRGNIDNLPPSTIDEHNDEFASIKESCIVAGGALFVAIIFALCLHAKRLRKQKRKVASVASVVEVQKDVNCIKLHGEVEHFLQRLKNTIDHTSLKHVKEWKRFIKMKNYHLGLVNFIKFHTMEERQVKQNIRFLEIASKDLRRRSLSMGRH